MPNLPENIQYGTSGTQSPTASFSNLANLTKNLQQKTASSSSKTFGTALTDFYNPNLDKGREITPAPYSYKAPYTPGTPYGEQAAAPEDPTLVKGSEEWWNNTDIYGQPKARAKTEPLPEGYSQWDMTDVYGKPITTPPVEPSLRNWPVDMGGGQYVIDKTQPGAIIKSTRAIMDEKINPGARKAILGNLSPSLYEVDHIVPLWAGGSDTLANLEALDKVSHNKKTAIQSVALTLLRNQKITPEEAKLMVLTWKDKDQKKVPSIKEVNEGGGMLPLKTAESFAEKWKKDLTPSMWKFFGESFKENMAKFGKDIPILGEFGKGLVGGTGIIPGTEALPESGTVGKVSNFVGNLVSTITGIGLVSKGLAGVGAFGKIAKAGSVPFLKYAGTGIGAVDALTGLGKAGIAVESALAAERLKMAEETISKVANIGKWTGVGKNIYQNALSLAVFGQMGLLGREMTQQEAFDYKKNLKQAASDIIFGGLLGGATRFSKGGQSIPGYLYVGGASTSWSLMQGAPVEDAVKEGIIMTALHGMGYKKGAVDVRESMLKDAVYAEASAKVNKYTNGEFPIATKKSEIPTVLEFDAPTIKKYDDMRINYPGFKDPRPITNTAEALSFLENVARKEAKLFRGNVSEDKIVRELQSITTAFNEIKNQTLPPSARMEKTMLDQYSISKKMLSDIKGSEVRSMMSTPSVALSKIPEKIPMRTEVPSSIQEQYKDLIVDEGNSTTRGIGRDKVTGEPLNPVARQNLQDFASGKRESDGRIYIAQNEQTIKIGKLINQEALENKQPIQIDVPENTLPTFMKDIKTGEFLETGYIPAPRAISEANPQNINKIYTEKANLLKSMIYNSKDAETLMNYLNKDKAFKNGEIDLTRATELFKMKDKLSKMTVKEFMETVNPPNPLIEYTIDNSKIAPKMKELKVPVLVVNVEKMSPIGKGENPNDPSVEFSVTKSDYLRSIALQEKRIEKATPVQQAIEKKITEQKTEKVSTSEKAIKKIIEKPIQPTLPIPKDAVSVEKSGIIQRLVEKGKITKEEAAPFIEKEKRFLELDKAAGERYLEYKEKEEMKTISRELHQLLQEKGIEKKPVPKYSFTPASRKMVEEKKNSLLKDALIQAESSMEEVKGKRSVGSPETFMSMLKDSIGGARSMISSNKLKLSSADQRELLKNFNKEINNLIISKTDATFSGGKDIVGREYSPEHHQFVGWDPRTGKETPIKKIDEIMKVGETSDQVLAKQYGLELKDDGYLKLDKGAPVFSEQYKKENPKIATKTPIEVYGDSLVRDLEINTKEKTIYSEGFNKELDVMEKSPGVYSKWAEIIRKGLKKIIVDPQDPWLKKLMKENSGKSFSFNSLMRPGSSYQKQLWETLNTRGHTISQPVERIIAQVEGKSQAELRKIDERTKMMESEAELARAERGISEEAGIGTQISEGDINKKTFFGAERPEDYAGGISPEDLKGMSIAENFQKEKVQDLTNFELRFPSLIYEEVTGKTPPVEAVATDAIRALKDFVSSYNSNIGKGSKINKIIINDNEAYQWKKNPKTGQNEKVKIFDGWNALKKEVLGENPDAKGGSFDGQGGFFSNIGNAIMRPFSSVTKYIRPADPTYNVRGVSFTDKDLDQIAPTIALEISNRPGKNEFETGHIVNTAINRALTNKNYKGSLVNTIQAPAQYQAYAPSGSYDKRGNPIESRYQKLLKGTIQESEKQKLKMVREYLNKMKNPDFTDTTGGKQFYVHASDGSLWLGKTSKEAKDNANKHEKELKKAVTNWRTVPGLPVQVAKR